ncbi:MAG: hypothetical protein IT380_21580 [Myxococcales bacterium]|nr:hypothetical protein [Myxococcales bacterium]
MPSPSELWAAADAAWARRDAEAALRLVDELLTLEPTHLDALNLSGFVRTTVLAGQPDAFDTGLRHLERALDAGTRDSRVIVNYAQALARKGRGSDAITRVRAWLDTHPDGHAAWNVLGWLLGVVGDDWRGGQAALEAALRGNPWYGDARLNLGRLYVKRGLWGAASLQLAFAVQSKNCWRPHEAWTRLGEVHVARGHLRRALGAFRRAQEVDAKGEYTRQLFDAVNALTHVLHQHRRFVLQVFDETARNRAMEERRLSTPPATRPLPLAALAERARGLRSSVREAALTALECIEEQATARALLPRWSDQSATFDLEQHGAEEGRALGLAWRAALFELYEELLEREEPEADPSDLQSKARQAAAERRWDDARAALLAAPQHPEAARDPEVVAALAERWGDRLTLLDDPDQAQRFYAVAEDAFAEVASWATAGGEGLARLVDVERLRKRRDVPERDGGGGLR